MPYAAQVAIAIYNAQLYDELKATKDELEQVMLGQFATLRRAQMQQDLGLSDEDLQVLALVADGASNDDIGATLNWSPPTVKRRLHDIFAKLGARCRARAAAEAVRRGLI